MICMKNLRFSSCPGAKVGCQGSLGFARAQAWTECRDHRMVTNFVPHFQQQLSTTGWPLFFRYSIHSHELKTDLDFIWWCMFFSSCLPGCKCVPCFKNLMYLTCITMPNLPPMMTRQKPQNVLTFCHHFPNTLEGWKKKLLILNQEHGRKMTRTFNQLGI